MKKTMTILLLMTLSACASPQYNPNVNPNDRRNDGPTINGDIYMGTSGTYGRIGVSTSNFGISLGV